MQNDSASRFTPEPLSDKTTFELPTEPGFYLDRNGDLWHVNGDGRSECASCRKGEFLVARTACGVTTRLNTHLSLQ